MQRVKEHRFNVGDGQMHYNQGLHQPELAKSSSKESLFDFNESPTNLGVTVSNGYIAKSLPESSDESSLPCTPEQHSDSETGASVICASNQVLDNDTITTRNGIELGDFHSLSFLREFTGLSKCRWSQSKALSTMKRVVEDVLSKHRYAYNVKVL